MGFVRGTLVNSSLRNAWRERADLTRCSRGADLVRQVWRAAGTELVTLTAIGWVRPQPTTLIAEKAMPSPSWCSTPDSKSAETD